MVYIKKMDGTLPEDEVEPVNEVGYQECERLVT